MKGNYYYDDTNRVYQFSDTPSQNRSSLAPSVLDLTELNNQFVNQADGKTVDYLADFDHGDVVSFSDTIVDIQYNDVENATTFYFIEVNSSEKIGWKFDGDLTDQYNIGDTLNLSFDVVDTATCQDITFESLDYFGAAFARDIGDSYPSINDYK